MTTNSTPFYYLCTNRLGHKDRDLIIHWTAPYSKKNCWICPVCGWEAGSAFDKKMLDAAAKESAKRMKTNPWHLKFKDMVMPSGPGFVKHRTVEWKGKQPKRIPAPNYIEPRAQ